MATLERLGMDDQLAMSELSLECFRLNAFDDLWTGTLEAGSEAVNANGPALGVVVGEMGQLLQSISAKTPRLRELVSRAPFDLDAGLNTVIQSLRPEVSVAMPYP